MVHSRCHQLPTKVVYKLTHVVDFDILKVILYANVDQILPNKSHGPMHYNIGVTCVYNGHVFYTLL